MNAVSHFDDVDYVQRVTDVVTKVCAVIPEIAESVADLPECLTKARNELAHQLPLDEEKEPLEVRYLRWLVVANITPWLLRGLLLLEAGIDPRVPSCTIGTWRMAAFSPSGPMSPNLSAN